MIDKCTEKMNRFELFTLIYFWLDSYYKDATDDRLITQISDMNPFIWEDIGSADPVAYIDFCEFIGDKEITVDNSLEIAKEYVKTIDYADVKNICHRIIKERMQTNPQATITTQ